MGNVARPVPSHTVFTGDRITTAKSVRAAGSIINQVYWYDTEGGQADDGTSSGRFACDDEG